MLICLTRAGVLEATYVGSFNVICGDVVNKQYVISHPKLIEEFCCSINFKFGLVARLNGEFLSSC